MESVNFKTVDCLTKYALNEFPVACRVSEDHTTLDMVAIRTNHGAKELWIGRDESLPYELVGFNEIEIVNMSRDLADIQKIMKPDDIVVAMKIRPEHRFGILVRISSAGQMYMVNNKWAIDAKHYNALGPAFFKKGNLGFNRIHEVHHIHNRRWKYKEYYEALNINPEVEIEF